MGINFPNAPTLNQLYPQPAVAGVPVYKWDGEKWITSGSGIYVDRAPFEAMAYSGLQINGGFEVSQELGTAGILNNGAVMDGWRVFTSGAMVTGNYQSATTIFSGFNNCLLQSVGTAAGSLSAGDVDFIYTPIEGFRIARLAWGTPNAQPITIAFWSAHHRPGMYSVAVRNSASNRSYVSTYTHAAADIPQFNTVTIPGDIAGTWPKDNTSGLILSFAVASGTTLVAPAANAWYAGNYIAAPGQVNAVAATSDCFRITGVIVLPGNEAPSAARSPFVMRPFPQELEICKRYYQKFLQNILWGYEITGAAVYHVISLSPSMRAAPTLTCTPISNVACTGPAASSTQVNSFRVYTTLGANGGCYTVYDAVCDARL